MIKKGFTLSEVLIALVIIGVIAAITVPNIIANYRRTEASAKIKKFYSVMYQAAIKAQSEGNNWDYWAEDNAAGRDATGAEAEEFGEKYLLPYLSYYKYELNEEDFIIYLNDGTNFFLRKAGCLDFIYDINGDKKPNTEGRDRFRFLYCPESASDEWLSKSKFIPYLKKNSTREKELQACKELGLKCTGLLSIDGWEFKEDYPYSI